MAASKVNPNLCYHLPEEGYNNLFLVRDSLKLLMNCAEDGQKGTIEPRLLASHIQLLVEKLNEAMDMTDWAGNKA